MCHVNIKAVSVRGDVSYFRIVEQVWMKRSSPRPRSSIVRGGWRRGCRTICARRYVAGAVHGCAYRWFRCVRRSRRPWLRSVSCSRRPSVLRPAKRRARAASTWTALSLPGRPWSVAAPEWSGSVPEGRSHGAAGIARRPAAGCGQEREYLGGDPWGASSAVAELAT